MGGKEKAAVVINNGHEIFKTDKQTTMHKFKC